MDKGKSHDEINTHYMSIYLMILLLTQKHLIVLINYQYNKVFNLYIHNCNTLTYSYTIIERFSCMYIIMPLALSPLSLKFLRELCIMINVLHIVIIFKHIYKLLYLSCTFHANRCHVIWYHCKLCRSKLKTCCF